MLNYFPKFFTSKAITLYLAALVVVTVVFINNAMPLIWWIFGIVEVAVFFYFSNQLTRKWANISEKLFVKKVFQIALILRVVWVFFSYFFFIVNTGQPFEFGTADAFHYHTIAQWMKSFSDFEQTWTELIKYFKGGISDTGYSLYLIYIYRIFGDAIILTRIIKALVSAWTCVFIYRLAARNFGDSTGRIAAVLCMLMPNLILYAGLHLKEAEMVFLTVWFVERADNLIRNKTYSFSTLSLPIILAALLFLFRTVLGATALFSLFTAIFFSSKKVMNMGKKFVLGIWVFITMIYFVGGSIATEVEQLWEARGDNQKNSMEWRANREGGNQFAKYATGAIFAPMILVIPFPTMVETQGQENQRLIHGGNYVKNIMAFFTMFALFLLVKEGKWRDHLLISSFTIGYLVVIALSAFAQSERFHQPALPFILVFAAYGISRADNKTKRYYTIWLAFIFVALIGWSWFKLAGRGMA